MGLTLSETVAVALVGLLAGMHVSGSFGLNPAIRSLDAATYLTVKQACDRSFPVLAKPLLLSALAATALSVLLAATSGHAAEGRLCAVALAALIGTLLAILRGDLPLNREMATWAATRPPAELAEAIQRWDRFFTVRTASSVLAFVALLVALQVGR